MHFWNKCILRCTYFLHVQTVVDYKQKYQRHILIIVILSLTTGHEDTCSWLVHYHSHQFLFVTSLLAYREDLGVVLCTKSSSFDCIPLYQSSGTLSFTDPSSVRIQRLVPVSTTCYRYIVVPYRSIKRWRYVFSNDRPAREVRPNQTKYRFHDHNREGSRSIIDRSSHRRKKKNTNKNKKET